jgi:hypothetical protein
MPANSVFNRGQWKPGQSGNPSGRPKRATVAERLRARSNSPREGQTPWSDEIIDRLLTMAAGGDAKMITLFFQIVGNVDTDGRLEELQAQLDELSKKGGGDDASARAEVPGDAGPSGLPPGESGSQ